MADQQDRPDDKPDDVNPATESAAPSPGAAATPPADEAGRPPAEQPPAKAAKKAPAKAAKKGPAKAAKKAAAKKAPAKKTPAKKAPAKQAPAAKLADTNGNLTAAKEAAAQAKSTVASANNPVGGPPSVALIGPEPPRIPIAAVIAAGLLAILIVLIARRNSGDG
jgi:hypothetical protein